MCGTVSPTNTTRMFGARRRRACKLRDDAAPPTEMREELARVWWAAVCRPLNLNGSKALEKLHNRKQLVMILSVFMQCVSCDSVVLPFCESSELRISSVLRC
jgi:hypothetical protein